MSRLYLSSKHSPRVLEDGDVLDRVGVGVRVLNISLGSFTESFITSASLSRLYLSSKSFPGVWEDWDVLGGAGDGSGYSKHPREALLKVSSRSNIRKLVKTSPIIKVSSRPPSLFLKSWRIGMFLMELEMVSRYSIYPRKA